MKKVINVEEMSVIIETMPSNTFAGLKTMTKPKLLKKGRDSKIPFEERFGFSDDQVVKFSEMVVGMGYEYQKMIENRLIKEGKDVTEYERGESWHIPYKDSKTIRIKKSDPTEMYFMAFLIANTAPKSEYVNFATGDVIDREMLREYLPVEKAPDNQGLSDGNEVLVRTFKMESIYSLSACGDVYSIRP